jgi:hypothetical protein
MLTDYFAVIFDFKRGIFKGKKLIEDVEPDSQTISRLRVLFYSHDEKTPLFK